MNHLLTKRSGTSASVLSLTAVKASVLGIVMIAMVELSLEVAAEAILIVSPDALEQQEGSRARNPGIPYPSRTSNSYPNGFRVQELYPSSLFAGVGDEPLLITQVALRPDISVTGPIDTEWDLEALNLSTTQNDEISATFEDNYGPDGFETVLTGVIPLHTDGVTPTNGLPHDFDYVFNFNDNPFRYDPREGNLLVEWISSSDLRQAHTWHDTHDSTSPDKRFAFGNEMDAALAVGHSNDMTVTQFEVEVASSRSRLQAGDADQDLDFDQLDLVMVQIAAQYLTGQPATWGEGDWDGAPGGTPGSPPAGNGRFDQLDIIGALSNGIYLTGPYAAVQPNGGHEDGQTSIVYDVSTGEVGVDAPAGLELKLINLDSAAGIFTGNAVESLGGSFDNDADANIFKAVFGGSFGSVSFGNVAQTGLSEESMLGDISVVGSLAGGGDLGDVDLVYVPEPSTIGLCVFGLLVGLRRFRRTHV